MSITIFLKEDEARKKFCCFRTNINYDHCSVNQCIAWYARDDGFGCCLRLKKG